MRLFPLLMTVVCFFLEGNRAEAGGVLTPAEAAKQEGKKTTVTVELVVKSCHPLVPDGKEFRLISEATFEVNGAFVVRLKGNAIRNLSVKDLEKRFRGKTVRVTGKVETTIFSSSAETRPGITVDDPKRVTILEKKD